MELRADAELDARELIALKLIYYALYSVVTAVRAFAAYSEPAAGERDVVKNYDYLFGRNLVERGYVAHRLAGVVHECLGLCENAALAANFRVAYEGVELQAVYFYIVLLREEIEAEKASIVAGKFIFLARVAEPDYQKFGRADSAGSASEKIHIFFPYILYGRPETSLQLGFEEYEEPKDNIHVGAYYLKYLENKFNKFDLDTLDREGGGRPHSDDQGEHHARRAEAHIEGVGDRLPHLDDISRQYAVGDDVRYDITGLNVNIFTNHRRYSNPAAFSNGAIQLRTAGSPVIGIGYTHQKLRKNPSRTYFIDKMQKKLNEKIRRDEELERMRR